MARSPKYDSNSFRSQRHLRFEGLESRTLLTVTPVNPIDLGAIDYVERADVNPSGGDVWFEMESTMAAYLSVSAAQPASGTVNFTLYDSAGEELATSRDFLDTERLDYDAPNSGQTYYLCVQGTATDVDLALANLVRVSDNVSSMVVTVRGTADADTFSYQALDIRESITSHWVTVNDIQYQLNSSFRSNSSTTVPFQINFAGRGGNDTITVTGTSGEETATLYPTSGTVEGANHTVSLTNIESITVNGAGGYDSALLYDSATNDLFVATTTGTTLSNTAVQGVNGYTNSTINYESVGAIARSGGIDTARIHGTTGVDTFVGRSEISRITGTDYVFAAKYFDYVHAYGHGNAKDAAVFYDTDGDDTFVVAEDYAKMYSILDYGNLHSTTAYNPTSYFNRAIDFANVYGRATGDGNDVAIFHDTTGNDTLVADELVATLTSSTRRYEASAFSQVTAISSNGGYDIKRIRDPIFTLETIGPWHLV